MTETHRQVILYVLHKQFRLACNIYAAQLTFRQLTMLGESQCREQETIFRGVLLFHSKRRIKVDVVRLFSSMYKFAFKFYVK
jgi:hypothetical protein